jgi:hypothetical protein
MYGINETIVFQRIQKILEDEFLFSQLVKWVHTSS